MVEEFLAYAAQVLGPCTVAQAGNALYVIGSSGRGRMPGSAISRGCTSASGLIGLTCGNRSWPAMVASSRSAASRRCEFAGAGVRPAARPGPSL